MIEINSKPGTKVIYYKFNSAGDERSKEYANKFLKNGNIYTVEFFRCAYVGLAEIPGELFNPELFAYKTPQTEDIVTYTDEEIYDCCDDQLAYLRRLQENGSVNLSLQQLKLVKDLWSTPKSREETWEKYQSQKATK